MDGNRKTAERTERNRFLGHGQDSFEPLGPECTRVGVKLPMAPADLEKVARLLEGRPEVTLHFHSSPGTDLEFLKHFPFVRRLSVHLWYLEDISGFSYLQNSLELLSFGRTQKRLSLKFLQDMPALETLSLEGHTKDIASVSRLTRLTSLGLRSITLPDLFMLAPLRELTSFRLSFGGTRDLAALAELPKLKALHLLRINLLDDLSILAKLTSLKTLGLDSMRKVTSLPNLGSLTHLEEVGLETMKGLTGLAAVAAAPALRRLTISGMPQLDVDAFHCLVDHPSLQELRLWSSLGGAVNLRKPVHEAVRQLLPDIIKT
ncbi:internalin A [Dyella sp. OK004]|uniref:leucine-rich repeat domain-containing protein n=1 Tax=Dyella sp. OK004 TaxID=1855292 RepID=UPI0008F01515|nr:leucine-rich repeat domain-containing protein [Dyella sp. OK004]SFS16937.1 internalin A [Dyella sp. OK004]